MKNELTKRITIDGMFMALLVIMTFVPYVGFIPLTPAVSITLIHVPVLIAAMLFGWKDGLLTGLVFGLCSLIKAAASPLSPLDPFFVNPLVSVLPRAIFGLLSGLLFDLIRKIKDVRWELPLFFIGSGLMTFVHSVLTLSSLYLFTFDKAGLAELGFDTFASVMLIIFTLNGLLEVIVAVLLVPSLSIALFKAFPDLTRSPLKDMKTNYKKIVAPYYDACLADIKTFCGINSVYDETTVDEENPFGKGVSKALNWIKSKAEADGFKAANYSNKVVEISFGEGDKNLTIMAHADVVPATGNWTGNPFEVRQDKTHIYGRGVSDDKGPLLCSYYAIKALRENNLLGGYTIRLLVGGNEESGSAGMIYYFNELKKPQPTYGFTPDADWPLIFAEKAITNFVVDGYCPLKGIKSMKGGAATNAVIDEVNVVCDDTSVYDYLKNNIDKVEIVDENTLKVLGKSAHGSMPELGDNAALKVLGALADLYKCEEFSKLVVKLSGLKGEGFNIAYHSESMGDCSLNLGLFEYKDNQIKLTYNYRHVDGVDFEEVKANANEAIKPLVAHFDDEAPELLYYSVDSPLITNLMAAYKEETGDMKAKPLAIGGGTYAKEASNVVAFGMQYPGEDTHMHEPDECLNLEHLRESMAIYANAIIKLGDLIKNEN